MDKIEKHNRKAAKERALRLLSKMTLEEKIGQVNQRLYGFQIYSIEKNEQGEEDIILSEEFKQEVKKYGGLGVLYGLYRADPWSRKDEKTGLAGKLAVKAYNKIQCYIMEHSRLSIPMLLSTECPHGHQALHGYLLPVNLAMGATFHPYLVQKAYQVCAKQLKEMGVNMALVSTLDILRDARWGRSEECYSEDPYLASELAKACVEGIQGEGVAAVAKHFCAQGEGTGGVNASAARIGERELREIHLPAMRACCQVNVQGVMAAYNEIDGIPCHANKKLLSHILRGEMGFDGVVMADGIAIDQLDSMTGDNIKSAEIALRAGVDIGLWDEAYGKLHQVIERNAALEKELDRAVLNILTMKYQHGLFEHPFIVENEHYMTYHYDHYEESLQLARESVVLLENREHILPLSLDTLTSIAVIGPNSDTLYHQLGDYTPSVEEKDGVTVLQGIRHCVEEFEKNTGKKVKVKFEEGISLIGKDNDKIKQTVELAKESDITVLVLGGSSSRFGEVVFEANGAVAAGEKVTMDCGEGVDSATLELPGMQKRLAEALFTEGIPVIVVSIQGRPYAMEDIAERANALLLSFYPGMKGGQAISEILFGRISPSGCLPVSIPRHVGQLPVYYNYKASYQGMKYYDILPSPLYSFGFGRSYTDFEYEDFQIGLLNKAWKRHEKEPGLLIGENRKSFSREMLIDNVIGIYFTIKNTGNTDAFSVPQLYIRQEQSGTIRRIKELKAFDKIWVPKGEARACMLTLDKEKLSVWDENMSFVVEQSRFFLYLCDGIKRRWTDTIRILDDMMGK